MDRNRELIDFDVDESAKWQDTIFELPAFVPGCIGRVRQVAAHTTVAAAMTVGGFGYADEGGCVFEDVEEILSVPAPGSLHYMDYFPDCVNLKPSIPPNIESHLRDRVAAATIPPLWMHQRIASPSDECYAATVELLKQNYSNHGLLPAKVLATKSSSLYVSYVSGRTGFTLRIEVDEDLDAIASISNSKSLLESGAFEDEFASRSIAFLQGTILPQPPAENQTT